MTSALINRRPSTASATETSSKRELNPFTVAFGTAAACIAIVWAATVVILMMLTSVPFWGAFGVGAYAAFWLGGGFGAIFGSAAVFGRQH